MISAAVDSLQSPAGVPAGRPRRRRSRSSLLARGEPMLWLTGSALVCCVLLIISLLAWIAWNGFGTFWPQPVALVITHDGERFMGEITRTENAVADAETGATTGADRELIRTGNYELTGTHFHWVARGSIEHEDSPEWAVTIERLEWGRFYGFPEAYVYLRPVEVGAEEPPRVRAEAVLDGLKSAPGKKLQLLVARWVGGHEQEVLIDRDAVRSSDRVKAVAEVWLGRQRAWAEFQENHDRLRDLWRRKRELETGSGAETHRRLEEARLRLRQAELDFSPPPPWAEAYRALSEVRDAGDEAGVAELTGRLHAIEKEFGRPSPAFMEVVAAVEAEQKSAHADYAVLTGELQEFDRELQRHLLYLTTAQGKDKLLPLFEVVRAYRANQVGWVDRLGIYLSRWWEFLSDEPRESNFEGGVFPAIFGTVLMTLIMCLLVVPFGVLAALYLREYAVAGPVISIVRIAVNNLAGVPSIVFGVFGLGFFCYIIGGTIDDLFFAARQPQPTFGTGGLLWASLTLALLTLPVVIVATEEALSAVPNSLREGSYACGASKWQTIRRIVLPRAMPGIMTGAILAMARGAAEVAPLMLVGAVKLAPKLPVDTQFPFGLNRSFMHLGFHIYDLGFQSQNSEAAKPMVYTTTLLLIGIIFVLNLSAIWLRTRLQSKFVSHQF